MISDCLIWPDKSNKLIYLSALYSQIPFMMDFKSFLHVWATARRKSKCFHAVALEVRITQGRPLSFPLAGNKFSEMRTMPFATDCPNSLHVYAHTFAVVTSLRFPFVSRCFPLFPTCFPFVYRLFPTLLHVFSHMSELLPSHFRIISLSNFEIYRASRIT